MWILTVHVLVHRGLRLLIFHHQILQIPESGRLLLFRLTGDSLNRAARVAIFILLLACCWAEGIEEFWSFEFRVLFDSTEAFHHAVPEYYYCSIPSQ